LALRKREWKTESDSFELGLERKTGAAKRVKRQEFKNIDVRSDRETGWRIGDRPRELRIDNPDKVKFSIQEELFVHRNDQHDGMRAA
jgi:hypothetical protein